ACGRFFSCCCFTLLFPTSPYLFCTSAASTFAEELKHTCIYSMSEAYDSLKKHYLGCSASKDHPRLAARLQDASQESLETQSFSSTTTSTVCNGAVVGTRMTSN
ncbi:hypothetical protein COOONC_00732, partial [Cooperia oncophora]